MSIRWDNRYRVGKRWAPAHLDSLTLELGGMQVSELDQASAIKATGIEERALKVGDCVPSFALFNQDHVQVDSTDLLRQGASVVSFFRGHW